MAQAMAASYRPHTATGRALRDLLARPHGTNGREVDKALRIDYGQRWLGKLCRDGSIVQALDANNTRGALGMPMAQYFLDPEHAAAWLALPWSKRPGLEMRAPAVHLKRAATKTGAAKATAWNKAGLGRIDRNAPVQPQQLASVGISSGIDGRYQLTPAEVAEVYRTGPLMAQWRALRGVA